MDDWNKVNVNEIIGSALIALGVGMIRLLMFIRRARKEVRWFDILIEPSMALFGGMLAWALFEVLRAPDIMQAALTSLGAWGGPRTIHKFEKKYLGGSRWGDLSGPIDLEKGKSETTDR